MKPKTLILMGIAIVCGLGASYMTSRLLADRSEPEVEKVSVVVAKKNLDTGIPLKNAKDLFELKQFNKGEEPKDALDALDKVKDKFLNRNLRKGDWVTAQDLTETPSRLNLPEGMRAMGIRVNAESVAGGWASLPGSRVDILWTARKGAGSDDETATKLLLENVLVLAADGTAKRPDEQGAILAAVVTVALNTEDCLRVTMAKDCGPLTMILRKPGDVTKAETTKVTLNQLAKNNAGVAKTEKGGTPEFEGGDGGMELKVGQLPARKGAAPPPPVIEPPAPVVEAKEPVIRKHVVTIVEGEHTRKVVYLLDENGQVSQEPVASDLEPQPQGGLPAVLPPPPAAQPAAPAQAAAQPAAPAQPAQPAQPVVPPQARQGTPATPAPPAAPATPATSPANRR